MLQGKDKCSNTHEDNGNLIHQHKSAQASLPEESYPDVLACSDHSTVPIMPPETVCCPCLSPADHTDVRCSQTAPPVSATPSLKTWQGEARSKEEPGIEPTWQPSGLPLTPIHLFTTFLPQLGLQPGHRSPTTLCEEGGRGQRAATGYCSDGILTPTAQPKSKHSQGDLGSKGTTCTSASPKTQGQQVPGSHHTHPLQGQDMSVLTDLLQINW